MGQWCGKLCWVVEHRRIAGVVWSGGQGAGSRLRRRRGETRAFHARNFPLWGGAALFATQLRWMPRRRILTLILMGGVAVSTGAAYASPLPQADTASRYTWTNFDGVWFCRSWSSSAPVVKVILPGTANASAATQTIWDYDPAGGRAYGLSARALTKCTVHWHVDSALHLVSDDAAWAANPTGEWPLASDLLDTDWATYRHAPRMPTHTGAVKHRKIVRSAPAASSGAGHTSTSGSTGGVSSSSGGYNPWAPVPGHPTYRMYDFAGDPYASSFGVCTWYAWYRHQSEPLASFGSAINWISAARSHGLSVGTQPVAGATVVFSPGVEGAGGTGHVGHVEQVLGGGWFIISEMNFYWNGGGWGKVDYRYAYVRSGVNFIY